MPIPSQFKTHEEYLNWYRTYRNKNRKKLRKYGREYNKKYRKENGYSNENKWKKENKLKHNCEKIAQHALKIGKIERKPCEICHKKAIMHHEDYFKPLEVRWICNLHHKHLHMNKIKLSPFCG